MTDFATLRRKGIGGSDVAAIAGLNPWKTPLAVWKEKVLGERVEENAAMRWGTKLEPLVLASYAEQENAQLTQPGPVFRDEWRMANVDALAQVGDNRRVVEAKTARSDRGWGAPGSDDVPDHYACQGQWYLDVMDLDRVDFAVLIAGSDFRIYSQLRIHKVCDHLRALADRFWNYNVAKEIPPDPVTVAEANDLWRKSTGRNVVLPDDVQAAIIHREQWKAEIKEIEQAIESAELKIKSALQDAEIGLDETGRTLVTWKTQVARRFDSARFKASHASLYEEYCNQTESRVLRIK